MRSFALLVATAATAPCTSDHCPDAEAAAMIQMRGRASMANPARDRDFLDALADPKAAARRFVDAPLQAQLELVRKLRELPDNLKAQLLEVAQAPEHSTELLQMTQFGTLASLDDAVSKKPSGGTWSAAPRGDRDNTTNNGTSEGEDVPQTLEQAIQTKSGAENSTDSESPADTQEPVEDPADTQEPGKDPADTQEPATVQASCNTLQCTASTHVDKPDKAKILCAGSACATDTDESTCCDLKASCDTLQCTASTHVDKPDKATILCAGLSCATDTDESTCCDLKASCDTVQCTASTHVDKPDKANIFCVGSSCATDTDESICCDLKASCDTLQCTASTHVDKPDKATILCADSSCATSTDESTCCDLKASCDTLQCTASTHVDKPNKASILCAGSSCTTSVDESTCCALKYTHVGTGVANKGGERWLGKGLGIDACYDAVMADTQCAKDYMSYVARGDENCGCNKAQGNQTRMSDITDVYKITEIL